MVWNRVKDKFLCNNSHGEARQAGATCKLLSWNWCVFIRCTHAQAAKFKSSVAQINLFAPGGEIPGRIRNMSAWVLFLAFSSFGAVELCLKQCPLTHMLCSLLNLCQTLRDNIASTSFPQLCSMIYH